MPAKTTAGGNALAKRLAYLTVADNEAGKPEELGLGAAQAQEEDARRAMAEKRKEAQKIEQQKLCQQAIQDVAATTREAESLRRALQAIKGMPLEARMAEVMANVSTRAQVLQRGKSVRTVRNLREGDAQEAMLMIFAYLAHTHDSMELTLKKVQSQTLFEQKGPEYAPVKLKVEYQKQAGNSVSAEMLAKELHSTGCDVSQMRKMGKDGQCAVPATMKQGGGNPYSAKTFSEAYLGDITEMTSDFTAKVDATGCVQLPSGQFALALLPPTAAYLVHLVVSSGDPGDLSGNVGAMVAMGLTQTEIERCLGVMVYEALGRETESREHLDGYRGVMITSEVVIFEPRGNGKLFYKHPWDPLIGARLDAKTALTTPILLGLQELGAPRLFMMMKSKEAAQRASTTIKQIEIKLPFGNGVYLTPAQIRDQRGHGPGMVESNLKRPCRNPADGCNEHERVSSSLQNHLGVRFSITKPCRLWKRAATSIRQPILTWGNILR
jgi:hypothetical protein